MSTSIDQGALKSARTRMEWAQKDLRTFIEKVLKEELTEQSWKILSEHLYNAETHILNTLALLPENPPIGSEWIQCESCGGWHAQKGATPLFVSEQEALAKSGLYSPPFTNAIRNEKDMQP